jgi:hypothetical protein
MDGEPARRARKDCLMPRTTAIRRIFVAAALLLIAAGPKADDDALTSTRPPQSLLGV